MNLSFPFFLILFSFLVKKLKRNFTWIAGVVALLGEFVTPQVFPWYWGSILAGDRFLAQTAEYMSIYGLTFLLFIISYTLYSLIGKSILTSILSLPKIQNPNWSRLYKIPSYGKEIIVLAMFTTVGFSLYWKWSQIKPVQWIDTLMIQPNAPLEFRDGIFAADTMMDLMNRIESLAIEGSASHPDPVDLVIITRIRCSIFFSSQTFSDHLTSTVLG